MNLSAILALAPRPTPAGTQPNPTGQLLQTVGMLVFFVVIFYFLLIRPQHKKAKEHAELVKNIRPGDKVLTNGGVIGVIVTVKEKSVTIRSSDSKMEVSRSAVTEVIERSGNSSDS